MKVNVRLVSIITMFIWFGSCNRPSTKPDISFENYKIEDGFEIELAAAEPSIEAPVAIDFDNKGRIWAVEMRGFMRDLAGTGEEAPSGRITILEDRDKDGYAETSKVFLEGLVLPRALAHVYGGLLYTSPPFLWFVEIENDKPGKKTLVDSTYAEGGSPESQANGLMMNIDNWIYSANSQFRYRLKDGKWLKEPTSLRGQFGIARDDYGRLYYNYNTIQMAGDFVLPNTLISNPYYRPTAGINKLLTRNHRVYPLHPTTVNRGYVEGVLDKDSMLVNVTAACGPMLYRGDQFPDAYRLNAFMCEPQGNLVKRNILTFKDDSTIATQAWNDREFLASTDEGFRPVNLSNGPDGAMYVVDMHRGIMEYRAFATQYYNTRITAKKLDTIVETGRILRIKAKDKKAGKVPDFENSTTRELLGLLKSKNGWNRDRAQQIIIHRRDKSVVPDLQKMVLDPTAGIAALHALYILEGLDALSFDLLNNAALNRERMIAAHALVLLRKFAGPEKAEAMASLAKQLLDRNDPVVHLYLAASLGVWNEASSQLFLPLLVRMSAMYPQRILYQEAIVSSLKGYEEKFNETVVSEKKEELKLLDSLLALTINNKKEGKMNKIFVQAKTPVDARTNGLALFRKTCAPCHGVDGDGIEHVAPPLKGSEYVEGSPSRLAMIILHGLEGPIKLNGQTYKTDNIMPAFASTFTDAEIADIIRYLQNAFTPKQANGISPEKIKELRKDKRGTLREKDLIELADAE